MESPWLDWYWDTNSDSLQACSSVWTHEGTPLPYYIEKISATWTAYFEGAKLESGTLEKCMAACREAEIKARYETNWMDGEAVQYDRG